MGNEDENRAIVGSSWPRNRVPESARQAVLDAAAVLQVRRSEAAALVVERHRPPTSRSSRATPTSTPG